MHYSEDTFPYDWHTLPRQKQLLQDIDWDVLIVLDAARWDAFHETLTAAEPVASSGSHTSQWAHNVWTDDTIDWSDVTYVSANGMVENMRTDEHYGGVIEDHIDTFVKGWDLTARQEQILDDAGTDSYSRMSTEVITTLAEYYEPPVVAHYSSPHYPLDGSEFGITASKKFDKYPVDVGDVARGTPVYAAARMGLISKEFVRLAYLSELETTWREIHSLRTNYDNVIITADHGEFLGPDMWNHPSRHDANQLRVVPFWLSNDIESQPGSPQDYGAADGHEWQTIR